MATGKQQAAIQTRERLVRAACDIIQLHGAGGLTLDAVARAAGISKGGLLHHFATKEALVEALLQQLFEDFERQVERHLAAEPPGPGRLLRAYVRATYADEPLPLEVATVLLAAVTENQALLAHLRADSESWRRRLLEDGVPAARAMVIRQATDAYWSDRMLGLEPADQAANHLVRDELLRLIDRGTS
jgi:AcrR family transcriptional regulator